MLQWIIDAVCDYILWLAESLLIFLHIFGQRWLKNHTLTAKNNIFMLST